MCRSVPVRDNAVLDINSGHSHYWFGIVFSALSSYYEDNWEVKTTCFMLLTALSLHSQRPNLLPCTVRLYLRNFSCIYTCIHLHINTTLWIVNVYCIYMLCTDTYSGMHRHAGLINFSYISPIFTLLCWRI